MIWRVLMVGLVAALCVPAAWAQRPPETHPASEQRDIVMTWDRSAMPGDIELWAPRTVLAYNAFDTTLGYGELHLVCESNADSARGRCPTTGIADSSSGMGNITLRFVEERSQTSTEVTLKGGIERALSNRSCTGNFWQIFVLPPWSMYSIDCGLDYSAGTGATLHIEGGELKKLVAGRWKATLELTADTPFQKGVAKYVFTFDLLITDHNAAAIYLPEFGHATPTVGLNLRYDPFAHTIGGSKQVDVCLYDGLGSQSQYLGLTVRDTSGHASGPTGFSVWHDDGGTDARRRLDYTLTLNHAGARVSLVNGHEHQLRNIDSVPLRLVMLPGMTYPVYCVPTPITFETPLVPSTSKDAGHYGGSLHVELRVPTSSP